MISLILIFLSTTATAVAGESGPSVGPAAPPQTSERTVPIEPADRVGGVEEAIVDTQRQTDRALRHLELVEVRHRQRVVAAREARDTCMGTGDPCDLERRAVLDAAIRANSEIQTALINFRAHLDAHIRNVRGEISHQLVGDDETFAYLQAVSLREDTNHVGPLVHVLGTLARMRAETSRAVVEGIRIETERQHRVFGALRHHRDELHTVIVDPEG